MMCSGIFCLSGSGPSPIWTTRTSPQESYLTLYETRLQMQGLEVIGYRNRKLLLRLQGTVLLRLTLPRLTELCYPNQR